MGWECFNKENKLSMSLSYMLPVRFLGTAAHGRNFALP